jgi:acyl carrier protein phosphodiesterase
MNYVAHLHIADVTQTSFAGNLLGDFSRGIDLNQLPNTLQEGLVLHQFVDVFVDAHPASMAFRSLPHAGRRRFVGIIQDILMDYWLLQYWSRYSTRSIDDFCHKALTQLLLEKNHCPQRLQAMIDSLNRYNWLSELGTHQGVENAIQSIIRRWRHGDHLRPFLVDLEGIIERSETVFLDLYPDLMLAVNQQQKN